MKKLLLFAAIIFVLVAGYKWLQTNNDVLPADPVTAVTTEGIKAKSHANVTIGITNLRQRMQRALAAPEAGEIAAIQTECTKLHNTITEAKQQLNTLGDSNAAIDQWLTKVQWPEFVLEEEVFRKAVAAQ